jgi:hypothetical protein
VFQTVVFFLKFKWLHRRIEHDKGSKKGAIFCQFFRQFFAVFINKKNDHPQGMVVRRVVLTLAD